MIPNSAGAAMRSLTAKPDWKQSLANAITDPETLLRYLQLPIDPGTLATARQAAKQFKLRVSRSFAARMQPGNWHDPLLRQVLPLADELTAVPNYHSDPVGDLDAMLQPGLLQKYPGRVLLVTTGACAIHCRYCFRREFPYSTANPKQQQWQASLRHIAADPSIHELILSGGDPLMLDNETLSELIVACEKINHLHRLRIHSRLPIVLPDRIDAELCSLFAKSRLQIIQVIHSNHAQELNHEVADAVSKLKSCSSFILNQAVLLKGVNDSVAAQTDLSKALTRIGVLPYYLHMLDRVNGTHHFKVDTRQAVNLLAAVRNALPGYMVPKLVQEIPGHAAKTPVPDFPASPLLD